MHERTATQPEPTRNPGRRIIILVVDDDAFVRQATRAILEDHGHTVLEAADGVEGVALFRRDHTRIHVVVLDIEMPRMDGAEAFRQIRAIRGDVPVIVVSGCSQEDYRHRLPVAELAGVLRKPFELDELLSAVGRCAPSEGIRTNRLEMA